MEPTKAEEIFRDLVFHLLLLHSYLQLTVSLRISSVKCSLKDY